MEYLGHIIDSTGLHPSLAKVQAIQKAPVSTNITELRAFLGLVNYYHKFLPNLSTLFPPHIMLRKGTKWNWTQNQQIAFDKVKELLQSDALLVHFDSTKPLLVYADTSPSEVGSVLAHKMWFVIVCYSVVSSIISKCSVKKLFSLRVWLQHLHMHKETALFVFYEKTLILKRHQQKLKPKLKVNV